MSTFLALLKTSLNINFGISALKYRFTREKKRLWEPVLIGVSVVIGIGTLVSMFSLLMFFIFLAGMEINKPEIVLVLSFVAGQLLVLIFGIFYIMSSFYFSKDLSILIPLPLKPSQVLGSKFAVVMINEYLTLLPALLPAIIIYGLGMKRSLVYWFESLIIFLAAPVIPLIIGAAIIMVLMRFINIKKSKDLLAVIGGLLSVVAAVGINFFAQRLPKGMEEGEFIERFLTSQSGLIDAIGKRFPPSTWATYALSRTGFEGIGYFILFIGVSVILFAALMWLGNRIFYRSILSGQEVTRKRKTLSKEEFDKRYSKVSNPVVALFWKEWKLFLRTPVYLMNGIVGMIIAPFLMLMPFIADNSGMGQEVFRFFQDPRYTLPVSLGGLALMLFTSNINIIASTSLSREGQLFWISKMIPVAPKQQVMAKILHGVAVEFIGIIVAAGILAFVTGLSLGRLLVLLVLSLLGSVLMVSVNLMIDVLRPKLEWTNPQEAVKTNINGVLGMLASMVVMSVVALAALLMVIFRLPDWLVYLVIGILITALAVPSVIGLFALAEGRYKNIET